MRLYLIDVEQLQDEETGRNLCERARELIDVYRRDKADKCRSISARGLSLGVGLALQLAARGYVEDVARAAKGIPITLTAEEAVKVLDPERSAAVRLELRIEKVESGERPALHLSTSYSKNA